MVHVWRSADNLQVGIGSFLPHSYVGPGVELSSSNPSEGTFPTERPVSYFKHFFLMFKTTFKILCI